MKYTHRNTIDPTPNALIALKILEIEVRFILKRLLSSFAEKIITE